MVTLNCPWALVRRHLHLKGRLEPTCLKEKDPVGLLIMDRKQGRFQLSETDLKVAGAFRDLLMIGLRKEREGVWE